MSKKTINYSLFSGGQSNDAKNGFPNSHAYSKGLDFRRVPHQLRGMPELAKDSDSTVDELVLEGVLTQDGKIYFFGDGGDIYTRTSGGTYALFGNTNSTLTGGAIYNGDNDDILYAGTTTVHRIEDISGSPNNLKDNYGATEDSSSTGGANTYTLGTAIDEGATHKLEFTPDIEPLYSINLNIDTIGTGTWTVTVHDDANNTIASVSVAAAALSTGDWPFVFTTPARMLVTPNARTYHVHVTSTVADGVVVTDTASDFSTADYTIKADRLISTNNGLHPMVNFNELICIGNGRYLSTFEPLYEDESTVSVAIQKSSWQRHRIFFPVGEEVCSLAVTREFLAIGTERRSDVASEYSKGAIYYWDGLASRFNFFTEIPDGAPYGLFNHQERLYYAVDGELWCIPGAGADPIKVRRMPNTDREFTGYNTDFTYNPHMMAAQRGILQFGFPTSTSHQDTEFGLYSFGSLDTNYPDTFGYDSPISTGTLKEDGTNNIKIGMVRSFGEATYVSWFDDDDAGDYGIDIQDTNSDPVGSYVWESLIEDVGAPYKEKKALRMKITFETLASGVTITPKYKINRGAWVLGTDGTNSFQGTAGDTSVLFPINKRFREIQVGLDGTATTAEPKIISITLEYEDTGREEVF